MEIKYFKSNISNQVHYFTNDGTLPSSGYYCCKYNGYSDGSVPIYCYAGFPSRLEDFYYQGKGLPLNEITKEEYKKLIDFSNKIIQSLLNNRPMLQKVESSEPDAHIIDYKDFE